MKVCPKCQAVNKEENRICSNCQSYLGPETIRPDDGQLEARLQNAQRGVRRRNVILGCLFFGFFAAAFFYLALILCLETGNIVPALRLLPLYLPPIALFLLPYDRIYRYFRRRRGKPDRPVPDLLVMLFRGLGVILLLALFGGAFAWFGRLISAFHSS